MVYSQTLYSIYWLTIPPELFVYVPPGRDLQTRTSRPWEHIPSRCSWGAETFAHDLFQGQAPPPPTRRRRLPAAPNEMVQCVSGACFQVSPTWVWERGERRLLQAVGWLLAVLSSSHQYSSSLESEIKHRGLHYSRLAASWPRGLTCQVVPIYTKSSAWTTIFRIKTELAFAAERSKNAVYFHFL